MFQVISDIFSDFGMNIENINELTVAEYGEWFLKCSLAVVILKYFFSVFDGWMRILFGMNGRGGFLS